MQQIPLIPEPPQTTKRDRPGKDDLRRRLSSVASMPEASTPATPGDEPDDPNTILRALIADLEEALEISRRLDRDLMTTLHRIVPEEREIA